MRAFFNDVVMWFHKRKPSQLFWLSALLTFSTTSLCISLIFFQARSEIFRSMRDEVKALAILAAKRVDGDTHKNFTDPAQTNSEAYSKAVHSLVEFHRSLPQLRYVYTMVSGNNVDYFILDTATNPIIKELHPGIEESLVMDPYKPDPQEDEAMNAALANGKSYVYRRPVTDAFGTFITAHAPFVDSEGKMSGFVGVDMDVSLFHGRLASMTRYTLLALVVGLLLSIILGNLTKRLREYSLMELETRKNAEAEEIRARMEAQELSRKKGEFLAIVAHDMKNPLGAITGWVDLLKYHRTVDSEKDYLKFEQMTLDNIHNAAQRMLSKVEEILKVEAAERVGVRISDKAASIRDIIEEVIKLNNIAARKKEIDILFTPETDVQLTIDRNRMIEAVDNIVNNAIKYSPHKRSVHIQLEQTEEEGARITITDNGPGFTPEDEEHMFQRFQTLSAKPTGDEQATGLGLAIAREIIEFHNGEINCQTTPGKGTTFIITLPAKIPMIVSH